MKMENCKIVLNAHKLCLQVVDVEAKQSIVVSN